jgi:hypothetical protein
MKAAKCGGPGFLGHGIAVKNRDQGVALATAERYIFTAEAQRGSIPFFGTT